MRAFTTFAHVDIEHLTDLADITRLADAIPVFPGICDTAVQAFSFNELDVIIPAHRSP